MRDRKKQKKSEKEKVVKHKKRDQEISQEDEKDK